MKQELFLIRNKQESSQSGASNNNSNADKNENDSKDAKKSVQSERIKEDRPQKEKTRTKEDEVKKTKNVPKPKESYASRASKKPKASKEAASIYNPSKVLFVADSNGHNLDCNTLEDVTKTRVDSATAYTVEADDDAKYKNKNFLRVVPERMAKKDYDTLILQGGCNEISNIHLSSKNVRSWQDKIRRSREKMFQLAEKSLKDNKHLKKVIILKSLPRYDPFSSDPSSIRSNLNQFGNSQYTNMWLEKGCPENIVIADQHMECQGQLRTKRYGNPGLVDHGGKPWDGIHMRGRLSVRHYTNSVIRILSDQSPHSTCPQTQYQTRQETMYKDADNFQFQRKSRNSYWRNHTQKTGNYGRQNTGDNVGYQTHGSQYGYGVGVSNRFTSLGN